MKILLIILMLIISLPYSFSLVNAPQPTYQELNVGGSGLYTFEVDNTENDYPITCSFRLKSPDTPFKFIFSQDRIKVQPFQAQNVDVHVIVTPYTRPGYYSEYICVECGKSEEACTNCPQILNECNYQINVDVSEIKTECYEDTDCGFEKVCPNGKKYRDVVCSERECVPVVYFLDPCFDANEPIIKSPPQIPIKKVTEKNFLDRILNGIQIFLNKLKNR